MVTIDSAVPGSLHDDLVEMLTVTKAAERDLFGMLDAGSRERPAPDGGWSPKDIRGHLGAWRSIEAHRLEAGTAGSDESSDATGVGATDTDGPIDEVNARLAGERAAWTWDEITAAADESIDALAAAIRGTPEEKLRGSSELVAGIGANGANHALGHLSDIAALTGGGERFRRMATEIEAIIRRGRLADRDAGTLFYNIACFDALSGRLDDARRLLVESFRLRPDLLEWAPQDTDVAALHGELGELARLAAGANAPG